MGNISDYKLSLPFKRMDVLQKEYVRKAKDIAIRLNAGKEVRHDEINEIRLLAVNDRNNLKGDFVISVFLELAESGMKFERWDRGKAVKINDKLARKIFENEITRELNVTAFCEKNRLTRNKYYRIAKCDIKDEIKKAELEQLKLEVERGI